MPTQDNIEKPQPGGVGPEAIPLLYACQEALSDLSPEEVNVLLAIKRRLDTVAADPEVQDYLERMAERPRRRSVEGLTEPGKGVRMVQSGQHQWARWLLQRRHGSDPEQQKAMLDEFLYPIRDKVLEHAGVTPGDVLLDVGAGDGLIAFGALPLVGEQGRVIFSDISQELLDHCQALADQMGMRDRCTFLRASADDLSALHDAAVDVITTRSVLAYVPGKRQAFQEFYRVLKPGGRLSIFEPIFRFSTLAAPFNVELFDVAPIEAIAQKVRAGYQRRQPPASDPMLTFDERDLLRWAEQAGFREVHLELRVDIGPSRPARWEADIRMAGKPNEPTLAEAMNEALTPAEAEQFTAYMKPRVERGEGISRLAFAYLWAAKKTGSVGAALR